MKMKKKDEGAGKSKILSAIVRYGAILGVVATSVVAMVMIGGSKMLPGKYLWPIIVVWLLAVGAVCYGIFRAGKSRKVRTIVASFFALLIVFADAAAIHYAGGINSFLSGIQAEQDGTERYSLIVLKSEADGYELSEGELMGYLASDPYVDDVAKFIKETLNAEATKNSDSTTLANSLTTKGIASALINDAYLDLFEENYEEFFETIVVVATYDISITTQEISTGQKSVAEPFILYISGIDVRDHTMPYSARSDVNILVIVNPVTHKILTVNTPRDFYVNLATSGELDKLTHAGVYGVNESIKTMENFYDIGIDYYARINFDALVAVVDAIGGIDVYSEYAFTGIHDGAVFNKGWNHLNGKRALSFARERVSISWAGGDRERGRNQQKLMEAIFKKMVQPRALLNINAVLDVLANCLQTNLSADSMKQLVHMQLDTMAEWEIENIDVDGRADLVPTYTYPQLKLFVWWPYENTVENAKTKIAKTLAK